MTINWQINSLNNCGLLTVIVLFRYFIVISRKRKKTTFKRKREKPIREKERNFQGAQEFRLNVSLANLEAR